MDQHYQIVPWFSAKEWHEVYNNIFSEQATYESKEQALQILFVWKSRCPSLPSAIESTLSLLEVYLKDRNKDCEMADNQIFRLSYSSAIMRFVNHMFDADNVKNRSLYQVAEKRGVPDWIIDLRHDTAHSNNLPALELLRDACMISLQWLQDNYWNVHSKTLKDYVIVKKGPSVNTIPQEHLRAFINFCYSLSFCFNPKSQIKSIANMPLDMQQLFIQDGQEIFGDRIDFSNLKKVSIRNLTNIVTSYSEIFFKTFDKSILCELLLNDESLFLSEDLYTIMSKTKKKYQSLDKQYVKCFEFLLKLLHTNDVLQELIFEFIKVTENNNNSKQCQLAALWVSEILSALKKTQKFLEIIKKETKLNVLESRKSTDIVSLFHHWFPNEKSTPLLLDLSKPVPSSLTDINCIRVIITTYNPYLNLFIRDLLELVKPDLPAATLHQICSLAKSIASPEMFPKESSRIYTVDDLNVRNDKENNELAVDNGSLIPNDKEQEVDSQEQRGIWRRASSQIQWSRCPIGLLPWQQTPQDEMDID